MQSKYWLFWLLINSGETLLFFVVVYVPGIIPDASKPYLIRVCSGMSAKTSHPKHLTQNPRKANVLNFGQPQKTDGCIDLPLTQAFKRRWFMAGSIKTSLTNDLNHEAPSHRKEADGHLGVIKVPRLVPSRQNSIGVHDEIHQRANPVILSSSILHQGNNLVKQKHALLRPKGKIPRSTAKGPSKTQTLLMF